MNDALAALRKSYRQRRVDYQAKPEQSQSVCQHLLAHPFIKNAQHIGCYLAFDGEIDCGLFIEAMWQQQKNIYLPICQHKPQHHMRFYLYTEDTPLQRNDYGILEPSNSNEIVLSDLDCVITPLIAFNTQLHRLGFGAGYYDHTFAFKLGPAPQKPQLLGLAYDWQQADWPTHGFDVPLDDLVVL